VILKRHLDRPPGIEPFPVTLVVKDWAEAQEKFFSDNGVFEVIHTTQIK
jgi:sulfate/thiosulfate transport system substrate-binding protein